jgi:hypothetical protein
MCLVYNKDGVPSYVRLCYRTGQAGAHMPVDRVVWYRGHVQNAGQAAGKGNPFQVPNGLMLHFRLGQVVDNPEVRRAREEIQAEMTRRYALASFMSEIDGVVYVSLHVQRANPHIAQRAETFGWQLTPWFEGLPPQPLRDRPAPRRKRASQWALLAVFERRPSDDDLTRLFTQLEDDQDRRWFKVTSAGLWELSAWRNAGWTATEFADIWRLIHELGGRAPSTTDYDGANKFV